MRVVPAVVAVITYTSTIIVEGGGDDDDGMRNTQGEEKIFYIEYGMLTLFLAYTLVFIGKGHR